VSAAEFFRISKLANLYPDMVKFDKVRRVIAKDPSIWGAEKKKPGVKENARSVFFNFRDFIKAFEIMATPDNQNYSATEVSEAKIKFFSGLRKAIDRMNIKSAAKGSIKGKL
jgi:hypothetical protein